MTYRLSHILQVYETGKRCALDVVDKVTSFLGMSINEIFKEFLMSLQSFLGSKHRNNYQVYACVTINYHA